MAAWLITGCSTGLGRALAQAVLARGHNAVVTARNAATLEDIAAAYPDTALATAPPWKKRTTPTSGSCSTRTFSAPST
ncbi:SDR family NAD(P)-dependent oxidoreductase [Arthrobacter oryzae]|uniref:SDR family NAD(P)-dependent oxidoreductase n=1 Tax=Arthrobacter oryzae TaxID=409290 RepID=UPI003FA36425